MRFEIESLPCDPDTLEPAISRAPVETRSELHRRFAAEGARAFGAFDGRAH